MGAAGGPCANIPCGQERPFVFSFSSDDFSPASASLCRPVTYAKEQQVNVFYRASQYCFTVQINIVYLASQIYLPSHFIAPLAAECLFCAAKLVLWSIHTVAAQK